MKAIRYTISSFCLMVSAFGLFAMMLLTCFEIFLRLFFDKSILGIYEYNELLLMYTTLMGLVYAYSVDSGIIKVELFIEKFPSNMFKVSSIFVLLFTLGLFFLLAYSGTSATYQAVIRAEHRHGIVQFPLWPLKLSEALCGLLMLIFILERLISKVHQYWLRYPDRNKKD